MEFGAAHDDLFVYDVASNRLRALTTDGPKHLQRLARFRGADAITFAAGLAGAGNPTGRLFEVPVGGGTPKKIADVGAALRAYAWDRKGRRAALMTEDASGTPSLRILTRATGTVRLVRKLPSICGTEPGPSDDTTIEWSPDGSSIILNDTFANPCTDGMVIVTRADGSDVVAPFRGAFARFFDDGRAIFYQARDGKHRDWRAMDLSDGSVYRLGIPAGGERPVLSPDGSRIALESADVVGGSRGEIIVYDIASDHVVTRIRNLAAPVWLATDRVAGSDPGTCKAFTDYDPCEAYRFAHERVYAVRLGTLTRSRIALTTTTPWSTAWTEIDTRT